MTLSIQKIKANVKDICISIAKISQIVTDKSNITITIK